jgi:RHS repeat-associated protein
MTLLTTRLSVPRCEIVGNTLTGGGRTNTWDSQNRLVQCAYNGTTTTNTYASDGLRHRSVVGANTTDYVLDSSMFVRELLNGTVKATYLVGPRGPEYRRDDQAGTIRWYVYDGLGSVVGEVAPDGTLTRSQSFDVYGCVRTSSGAATTKHKFVAALGHPSDDETGLIYMRARHYDPVCGRFVSEDSVHHGTNWFTYVGQCPTNWVDKSGCWRVQHGRAVDRSAQRRMHRMVYQALVCNERGDRHDRPVDDARRVVGQRLRHRE